MDIKSNNSRLTGGKNVRLPQSWLVDVMVTMAARVNPTLPFQHGLTSQSSIKLKSHPAAAFIQIWPRCRGSASWTAEGPAVCPTRCNHRWGYGWGLQKKTCRISDRVGALDSWESWGKYEHMIRCFFELKYKYVSLIKSMYRIGSQE